MLSTARHADMAFIWRRTLRRRSHILQVPPECSWYGFAMFLTPGIMALTIVRIHIRSAVVSSFAIEMFSYRGIYIACHPPVVVGRTTPVGMHLFRSSFYPFVSLGLTVFVCSGQEETAEEARFRAVRGVREGWGSSAQARRALCPTIRTYHSLLAFQASNRRNSHYLNHFRVDLRS